MKDTTRREFEAHMLDCPACRAEIDPDDGSVQPVRLCTTGAALEYAAQWDDGIEEFFANEARHLLASVFPEG